MDGAHKSNYEPCGHEIAVWGRFPATAIAWVDGIVERTQERGIYARQALSALENNACHRTAFVMER
jgi:hypothetical protein